MSAIKTLFGANKIESITRNLTRMADDLDNHRVRLDEEFEYNKRLIEEYQDTNDQLSSEADKASKIATKIRNLIS